eukprot:Opistho-2@76820
MAAVSNAAPPAVDASSPQTQTPTPQRNANVNDLPLTPTDLALVGVMALASGFGGSILYARRRNSVAYREALARTGGVALATKALGYGTILCGAFAATLVFTVRKTMDVHSMPEFAEKMRAVFSPIRQQSKEVAPDEDEKAVYSFFDGVFTRSTIPADDGLQGEKVTESVDHTK